MVDSEIPGWYRSPVFSHHLHDFQTASKNGGKDPIVSTGQRSLPRRLPGIPVQSGQAASGTLLVLLVDLLPEIIPKQLAWNGERGQLQCQVHSLITRACLVLECHKRKAFGACCCEQLQPGYWVWEAEIHFFGDCRVLQHWCFKTLRILTKVRLPTRFFNVYRPWATILWLCAGGELQKTARRTKGRAGTFTKYNFKHLVGDRWTRLRMLRGALHESEG